MGHRPHDCTESTVRLAHHPIPSLASPTGRCSHRFRMPTLLSTLEPDLSADVSKGVNLFNEDAVAKRLLVVDEWVECRDFLNLESNENVIEAAILIV